MKLQRAYLLGVAWMVVGLAVTGCEKITRAAGEASEKVKEKAGQVADRVGGEGSGNTGFAEEWRDLVDYDGTGYRFRRDLAFPAQVAVEEVRRTEVSKGRVFDRSVLGASSVAMEGVFESEVACQGGVDRMEVAVRKARFAHTLLEGAEAGKVVEVAEQIKALVARDLEGQTVRLVQQGGKWRMAAGSGADFRQVNWADSLADGMPVVQRICGVMPRPMWLGEKRYALGAVVETEGDGLQMLTGFPARGKMRMEFARVEALQGHPCGVFRVKGDFTATAVPRADGVTEDLEWSVSEGELWMSLVHPLVLRSDLKAVATVRRHRSGPQTSWQGQVHETVERTWKAVN